MSDDELFENWWRVHSPPGTFDKSQCKVAFIAGLVTQRVRSAQQSVYPTPESGGELPAVESNRKGFAPAISGSRKPLCRSLQKEVRRKETK